MNQDMHIQGPQVNQFNNISPKPIPRSRFRRDFTRRSTFDANYLVPVFVDEILPGDDLNVKMTAFARMSTPVKPLMDNLYLDTFWFFIPNRLVWDNWEKFQGMQASPGDSTAYTIPILNKAAAPMNTTGFLPNSLADHMGLPINVTGLSDINALFFRAYMLCYNEWFRDENINVPIAISTGDGPDLPNLYVLMARNKAKDYLTSVTPTPQKGTAISMGLTGNAPVLGIGTVGASPSYASNANFRQSNGTSTTATVARSDANIYGMVQSSTTGYPNVYADLTGATFTINALRQAALYQQILELDMRGGTRYVESIYSRFGVVSPDFRLQRPELIGQGRTRINIYAVPQTAPTTGGSTPQGNTAAFSATPISDSHGCRYAATEHGIILGLANVCADLTYQQGVPRMFRRKTRFDFYEPLLNGLGEQAVLNSEIYAQGTSADDDVFGYQERWSDLRFKNSEICGYFRSTAAGTLDVWHASQKFASLPGLNATFLVQNAPMTRLLATPTDPHFLFDASFSYDHVRPMPIRSNPGIDRL